MPDEIKDTDTLLQELAQETEGSNQKGDMHIAPETEIPATNFDQEPAPEAKPLGEDPVEIDAKTNKTAARYVKMFSAIMKMIFKPIYKRTLLEPGDIEKMRDLQNQNRGRSDKSIEEAISSDNALWPVVNRFDKYMKAVEDIALDKEEIEMLAEPLAEVLHKYKKSQLSPEWMLVISTGMVMIPRLAPMMPDITNIFKSKE